MKHQCDIILKKFGKEADIMAKKLLMISLILILCFTGCSRSNDTEEQQMPESYIEELTFDELTEEQISLFEELAYEYMMEIMSGAANNSNLSYIDELQERKIETYIHEGKLPGNGRELYEEWKASVNFEDQVEEWLASASEL